MPFRLVPPLRGPVWTRFGPCSMPLYRAAKAGPGGRRFHLDGIVAAPRALPGLAGDTECPVVNDVAEPGAREPHARFDPTQELETDRLVRATDVGTTRRESARAQRLRDPTAK